MTLSPSPKFTNLCQYPNCPSGVNVKTLDERHKEVKDDLNEIKENQKEFISVMKDVHTLLADSTSNRRDLDRHEKALDNIFMRLTKIEETKAPASEIIEMKQRGMDWLFDAVKIAVGAFLAVLGWLGIKYLSEK